MRCFNADDNIAFHTALALLATRYGLLIRRSLHQTRAMASNGASPRQIKIDVTSDTICPFCFIGKRNLDKAISIAKEKGLNLGYNIQYHPFLLDPTLKPDSARDKRLHYEKKFGKDRFVLMEKMMKERGKKCGIDFSYDGKISQTTDSHRLIAYAYEKGGEEMQLDLIEKLFNGYFEREQDVGNADFLAEQAVGAKLFPTAEDAKAWLATDEKKAEVASEIRDAQMKGITGVPFFVLNNKYAISGAEDPELFVEVFTRLAGTEAKAPAPEPKRQASDLVCT